MVLVTCCFATNRGLISHLPHVLQCTYLHTYKMAIRKTRILVELEANIHGWSSGQLASLHLYNLHFFASKNIRKWIFFFIAIIICCFVYCSIGLTASRPTLPSTSIEWPSVQFVVICMPCVWLVSFFTPTRGSVGICNSLLLLYLNILYFYL